MGLAQSVITLAALLWRLFPALIVRLLQSSLGLRVLELVDTLESLVTPGLVVGLVLVLLTLSALSAHDAFCLAKGEGDLRGRFARLFAPAAVTSYGLHVTVIAAAAALMWLSGGVEGGGPAEPPSAREAGGADSAPGAVPFEVELTEAPIVVDGFHREREGTTSQDRATERRRGDADAPQQAEGASRVVAEPRDEGLAVRPTEGGPSAGTRGQGAEDTDGAGRERSYNQYLSGLIRRYHEQYFSERRPFDYTVVTYKVQADGRVTDVAVLPSETRGDLAVAALAAKTIRSMAPAAPLPKGIRRLEVTELFWSIPDFLPPEGSLAERLAQLPDGRRITAISQ